jgi:ABC-type antimicrobial peptide transport system permease subunit
MYDPPWVAFLIPVLMITIVAGIATVLPALRARRIDPVILLRAT